MTDKFATRETGSWRTERPSLELERCNRCGLCVDYCPEGCVRGEGDSLSIDYSFCKGCGICAHECPQGAIVMVLEK